MVAMEEYYEQIRVMAGGYGVESVYVAGDDAETVAATVREVQAIGLQVDARND